jgi:hypothetical protein
MPPRRSRRPKTSLSSKFTFSPRSDGRGVSRLHGNAPKEGSVAIAGTNQVRQNFCPETTTTTSTGQSRGQPMPLNEQRASEMAIAHANGSMPRRPRGQGHGSTTTLHSKPPHRLPRTAGRHLLPANHRSRDAGTNASTTRSGAAVLPPWHAPATNLQETTRTAAPQPACNPWWPAEAAPSPTDLGMGPSIRGLHATSAPRSRWVATPHHHRVPEAAASAY